MFFVMMENAQSAVAQRHRERDGEVAKGLLSITGRIGVMSGMYMNVETAVRTSTDSFSKWMREIWTSTLWQYWIGALRSCE